MAAEDDRRITDVISREQSRLRNFVRRRVGDPRDVEDILQEVFFELVEANRRLMPIDHVTGWLFQVARNRMTDLFRRRRPDRLSDAVVVADDGEVMRIADLLPSAEAGPDAELVRRRLVAEIECALSELPDDQRSVFIAHELEGRSFKSMSAATGVNVNTLLARKRYAVLHLRKRLQRAFDEMRDRRGE
jgi:RNA polymerase sigma factor (sigma-70 family)